MKRFFAIAAIVLAASLAFSSCSKEDKTEKILGVWTCTKCTTRVPSYTIKIGEVETKIPESVQEVPVEMCNIYSIQFLAGVNCYITRQRIATDNVKGSYAFDEDANTISIKAADEIATKVYKITKLSSTELILTTSEKYNIDTAGAEIICVEEFERTTTFYFKK